MVERTATAYSRNNPFPGTMLVNKRISGEGKDTRHLAIGITGSGLTFDPGDSLAVYASNDPALVDDVLRALGASGDEIVPVAKQTATLREALSKHYSITQPTPKFLKALVERAVATPLLCELLHPEKKHDLAQYLHGMEIIDFLLEHPSAKFAPEEFVGLLSKLQPRLYSIASSLRAVPEAVHLIVDVVRYESHGRQRKGVASTFLAERSADAAVPVYPTAAKHFRLPEDPNAALIMVGPGTGIAPFRAFLQEREAVGANGRNWLFFGSQHEATDFFYGEDFKRWRSSGLLTRLDTAFSRDQAHKIYVQNRMAENGAEIWRWLNDGAYFYVCGDASRMAKDVDSTLHGIIQEHGGKSTEEAAAYVEQLKVEKRYRRDVY